MKLRTGGWQANVSYFKSYVIKTPKTKKEIRERIRYHYERENNLEELEPKIKRLQRDWKKSLAIIKSGRAPLKLFAYPEFLDDGRIKQRRVKMLGYEFEKLVSNHDIKGVKMLVDKVIDFILTLWTYGLHEVTFKFYTEMGLYRGSVVLVDIGELTDDKETVKRQLLKGHKKLEDRRDAHHDVVLDYYQSQIKKRLTLKKLDAVWGTNLSETFRR